MVAHRWMNGLAGEGEGCQRLLALLTLGFVIRIVLIPWGSFGYDIDAMSEWTRALVSMPQDRFYAADLEIPPDHLPGDLWILWLLGRAVRFVVPETNFAGSGYMAVLKLIAIVSDLVIGMLLYLIARTLTEERRALLVAAAFILNPAAIFVSAIWGQWDAVSMAITLTAVLPLLKGRLAIALPILTFAILIKPQLALLAPLFLVFDLRRPILGGKGRLEHSGWRIRLCRTLPGLLTGVALSLIVVVLVCLPFGVGLPFTSMQWSILDRIQFAADRYQTTTVGAYNLWSILIGTGEPPPDWSQVVLGLTYYQIGIAALAISSLIAIAGALLISMRPVALLWSSFFLTLSIFVLPTRVHERYFFPSLVFGILLCSVFPKIRWTVVGLTLTSFLNLYFSYAMWKPSIYAWFLHTSVTVRVIAIVNVIILALVAIVGFTLVTASRSKNQSERIPLAN